MSHEILIVDDDKELRFLLRAILSKKGFKVTEAADGKAAVDHTMASPPDLILMDIMMPIMDGITACQIIRNKESSAHIPIILLSALSIDKQKEKGAGSGANFYLTKPVPSSVLIETIDQALTGADHLE